MNIKLIDVVSPNPEELTVIQYIGDSSPVNSHAFDRRNFFIKGRKIAAGVFVALLPWPALKPVPSADAFPFLVAFLRLIAVSALTVAIEELLRPLLGKYMNRDAYAGYQDRANEGRNFAADQRTLPSAENVSVGAIWARTGHENVLYLHYRNSTGYKLYHTCYFSMEDVSSGKIQEYRPGVRHYNPIEPGESWRKVICQDFLSMELGLKRILVKTDDKRIICEPSCNILIAEHEDIFRS